MIPDTPLAVLYYYPEENCFRDEDGYTIYDVFKYLTPGELTMFKREKDSYFLLYGKLGLVELLYLEEDCHL